MLDKTFQHSEIESKHYKRWESMGVFRANPKQKLVPPYTIMMPPPNITGTLHMGHALTFTLQDILARYHRMLGYDVLWQPGTDHAGIATQIVVEKQLAFQGASRHSLGRQAFIEKILEWKSKSGGIIYEQLRRLGASPDWARGRFTLDQGLSYAVNKVFIDLYKQKIIYRDKRLVNWDPKLQTAISDLEVQNRQVTSKMWYFRYPIKGVSNKFITIATTRPETMLGDTGIAVHPKDSRYRLIVGQYCILPLTGKVIPIFADPYASPARGTGAVKITPAHDFNDFEIARRHNLPIINIFDRYTCLNENVPEIYRGLDRLVARDKIVEDMKTLGLLEKIEDISTTLPYGDRSGVVIEPLLTNQWFLDAKVLAEPALKAVQDGRIRFIPTHWENAYYDWLNNIQPWCISRQIWWGHQIPAWYGPDDKIFVAKDEEEAQNVASIHYGETVPLNRDNDVLDTWFSSALWPFSTLGWPKQTPELVRYYPTDVLVTGFDIIFFWVARMIMMGLHLTKAVPFHTVYIHPLVRDSSGQKMSKSKGNIINPLTVIDKYGCDALRFTLASLTTPGRDIRMSEQRVQGYRNFATKLWNAARFCALHQCHWTSCDIPIVHSTLNRWIISKVKSTEHKLSEALSNYHFNEAAQTVYTFVWNTFCDWYLEFIKPILYGPNTTVQDETRSTAAWVLEQILLFLHPFMPFLTEELWEQKQKGEQSTLLAVTHWPAFINDIDDPSVEEVDFIIAVIVEIRSMRAEINVPPRMQIPLLVVGADIHTQTRLATYQELIITLAKIERIEMIQEIHSIEAVQILVGETVFMLPMSGILDFSKERKRLSKRIQKLDDEINRINQKLDDTRFLSKAPLEIVEDNYTRRVSLISARSKLSTALKRLIIR